MHSSRTTYSPREGTETREEGSLVIFLFNVEQPIHLERGRKPSRLNLSLAFTKTGRTTYSPREGTETREEGSLVIFLFNVEQPIHLERGRKREFFIKVLSICVCRTTYSPREGTETLV